MLRDQSSRRSVEVLEQLADSHEVELDQIPWTIVCDGEYKTAWAFDEDATVHAGRLANTAARIAAMVETREADKDAAPRPGGYSLLLRDILGNPFRPVTVDRVWLTSNGVSLAQNIYTDRAFDRMPILADALEDAGCTDPDILAHCRGPGPHVRGCWVVDLLTGRQ